MIDWLISPLTNTPGITCYAVFSFLIAPFACRDYYGVLVVVLSEVGGSLLRHKMVKVDGR